MATAPARIAVGCASSSHLTQQNQQQPYQRRIQLQQQVSLIQRSSTAQQQHQQQKQRSVLELSQRQRAHQQHQRQWLLQAVAESASAAAAGADAAAAASAQQNGAAASVAVSPTSTYSTREATIESAMTSLVVATTPDTKLGEILEHFAHYTGVPVVDERLHCIGIVSNIDMYKKQRGRSGSVSDTPVRDVMTSPVVAVFPSTPIAFAAGLMLKYKVHRLPVVSHEGLLVGIVARSDIFQPLMSADVPKQDTFRLVP